MKKSIGLLIIITLVLLFPCEIKTEKLIINHSSDGDVIIMPVIQSFVESILECVKPLDKRTDIFKNAEVIQFIYKGKYIAFSRDDIVKMPAPPSPMEYTTASNETKIKVPDIKLPDPARPFDIAQLKGYADNNQGYQRILFGRYNQNCCDQPILWRILTVQGGQALLLSELILDVRPFDSRSNEWGSSDLKHWLNGEFKRTAFTERESRAVIGNGKIGDVFILGRSELSNPDYGFKSDKYSPDPKRSAAGTMTAYVNNLWRVEGSEHTNYYARTKANNKNLDLIAGNGKFVLAKIDRDNVGIRPALWVDISLLNLSMGNGSTAYPFQ